MHAREYNRLSSAGQRASVRGLSSKPASNSYPGPIEPRTCGEDSNNYRQGNIDGSHTRNSLPTSRLFVAAVDRFSVK